MATSKGDLSRTIASIKEEDIEHEFSEFAKHPDKVIHDLKQVTEGLTQKNVEDGTERYGSAEQFLRAILLYFAFKAALLRKGVKVGIAAGAGAALFFGAGSFCHAVAGVTGLAALDEIGRGIEAVGDLSLDVADAGVAVAVEEASFFGDIIDGISSLFS